MKELWDMITMVESTMTAWRTTSWREINVEDMELECKRFSKEIRMLDKEVRGETCFKERTKAQVKILMIHKMSFSNIQYGNFTDAEVETILAYFTYLHKNL